MQRFFILWMVITGQRLRAFSMRQTSQDTLSGTTTESESSSESRKSWLKTEEKM
jgi:hypothetical protein